MIIATDDERVYGAARSFGARVRMTRADHLSGTDRVAEVASAENAEIIVNIQGDEPLIDPAAIDAAILPLVHEPELVMGTLKKRIEDPREITDPNVVKVVTDQRRRRDLFLALPDSVRAGKIRPARLTSNTSGCTFISGISCWRIRLCRWVRWKPRNGWSNCARWRTGIAYA